MLSVIVPIYNAEQYLDMCINSICNQTYKDLEIILVDDCSTDNSLNICEKHRRRDTRIQVITLEKNSGSASAGRNAGLNVAKGDYIAFLDSDDFIFPTMYEKLILLLEKNNCDIAKCETIDIHERKYPRIKNENIITTIFNSKELRMKIYDKKPIFNIAPNNKVYKKSIFENIRFPENIIYEDEAIIFQILYNSNKIIITNEVLYCYYLSTNSVMRDDFSIKRLDILKALEFRQEYIKNSNDKDLYYRDLVQEYMICGNLIQHLYTHKKIKNRSKYIKWINERIKSNKFDNIELNKYFSRNYKKIFFLNINYPYIIEFKKILKRIIKKMICEI